MQYIVICTILPVNTPHVINERKRKRIWQHLHNFRSASIHWHTIAVSLRANGPIIAPPNGSHRAIHIDRIPHCLVAAPETLDVGHRGAGYMLSRICNTCEMTVMCYQKRNM